MSERPPQNDVFYFFVGIQQAKKENIDYCKDIAKYRGKFLREEFRFELDKLKKEIDLL